MIKAKNVQVRYYFSEGFICQLDGNMFKDK